MGGDSDAAVSLSSQFDNELSYSNTANTLPAIHSSGPQQLGFLPPTILDQASGGPSEVINLLNTPVTNTTVFEVKP